MLSTVTKQVLTLPKEEIPFDNSLRQRYYETSEMAAGSLIRIKTGDRPRWLVARSHSNDSFCLNFAKLVDSRRFDATNNPCDCAERGFWPIFFAPSIFFTSLSVVGRLLGSSVGVRKFKHNLLPSPYLLWYPVL